MPLRLSPHRVSMYLGCITASLIAISFVTYMLTFRFHGRAMESIDRLFFVDGEANLPAWFSSLLLLACGCALGIIARAKGAAHDTFTWHWRVLAAILVVCSIDECVGLHERTITTLRNSLGLTQMFFYSWVILGIAFVAVLGAAYLRFLFALPGALRNGIVLAALVYLGGAIGVEMLGGPVAEQYGRLSLGAASLAHLEEGMEMLGVIIFLRGTMHYMAEQQITLAVSFTPGQTYPTEEVLQLQPSGQNG